MPLFGVRDVAPLIEGAAVMENLRTEPVTLADAEVLQVMFEIDDSAMQTLLPKALHPTVPPTVTFVFWRCTEGPLGPFTLAQVRVGSRAGVRPRGFLLASYCDTEPAAEALRGRWGFDARPGMVRLRRRYDRIIGSVTVADRVVLQVSLMDPLPISGGDVQYVATMNLARVRRDLTPRPPPLAGEGEQRRSASAEERTDGGTARSVGAADGSALPSPARALRADHGDPADLQRAGGEVVRLVQVDPEFTFRKAERGRPVLDVFAPDAWQAAGMQPISPVSASYALCDLTLPRIRYVVDPDRPAMQATETVGE